MKTTRIPRSVNSHNFPNTRTNPLGNDPFVFEPEIEKVAQNKDRIGIAGNFVEPRHETFLDRTGRSRPPAPK